MCFGDFSLLSYKRLKQEDLNIMNSLLVKLLRQTEGNPDFKITSQQVIQIIIVTCVKSYDVNIPLICPFHFTYCSTNIFKLITKC